MKKLVIFSGLPGTGKSTLSKRYANEVDALWLSVDPIEGAMKLSGVENNHQLGVAAYAVMQLLADQNLERHKTVVIDAVNPVENVRQEWRKLAKRHHIPLHIIECVTPDQSLHKQRLDTRVRNIPGIREITWERLQFRATEYQPWQDERIILHTNKSANESYAELLAKLNPL